MGFAFVAGPISGRIHMYDVAQVLQYLIVVVLAVAAVGKLRDRSAVVETTAIAVAIKLPRWLAGASGPLLIAAEVSTVVLILVPPVSAYGSVAATLLFLGLTVGAHRAINLDEVPRCRCFGGSGTTLGRRHVVRNAVLLVAAVASASILLAGDGAGSRNPAHHVLTILIGLMLAMVMIYLDTLLFLGGWENKVGLDPGGKRP